MTWGQRKEREVVAAQERDFKDNGGGWGVYGNYLCNFNLQLCVFVVGEYTAYCRPSLFPR
ncbi:hypothetical protein J6590_083105 [Homalodisca vitripennis]|nr:hypothetical protein J6590_083105 [Homalodisca vitripennis]